MVKCDKCGTENADGSTTCRQCGNPVGWQVRHCVSCGRSIPWGANVCPYCGHDYTTAPLGQLAKERMGTGLKFVLYIVSILVPIAGIIIGAVFLMRDDPDEKRVGKICLIIGIVMTVVSIGLSALLYIMVLGFSGDGGHVTPISTLAMTIEADGVRLTFVAIQGEAVWDDVSLILGDGSYAAAWALDSEALTGAGGVTHDFGTEALSTMYVALSVSDELGNGRIDAGDSLFFAPTPDFSPTTEYALAVLYEPTDGLICGRTFTG